MIAAERYTGCLLGLALGDALGAPFEGGPIERLVWRFLGRTSDGLRRWTDDTQMALDIAESLLANGSVSPDDIARRFAASYRWSRGYGPGAARVLQAIRRGVPWREANRRVFEEGSWGNGAAMRSPVLALFCPDDTQRLADHARAVGEITHAHPLALEGAVLIATATAEALRGAGPVTVSEGAASACERRELLQRVERVGTWLDSLVRPPAGQVVAGLGNGVAAPESCVTALYLATRFQREGFDELRAFTVQCGGDVDTILAMAGAIWGAANGASALPSPALQSLEGRTRIENVAERPHGQFGPR